MKVYNLDVKVTVSKELKLKADSKEKAMEVARRLVNENKINISDMKVVSINCQVNEEEVLDD